MRTGNTLVIAIMLTITAALGAGAFYFFFLSEQGRSEPDQTACTLEAKLCPDGSYVGRTGPDCAFAPCPEETPDGADDPGDTGPAALFRSELTTRGVAKVGQPIEGFNAFLLTEAFSGLTEEDFDGVRTREGVYVYTEGELEFRRDVEFPVTSAEEMISAEGYTTLLANVSERLELEAETESDVIAIVEALE